MPVKKMNPTSSPQASFHGYCCKKKKKKKTPKSAPTGNADSPGWLVCDIQKALLAFTSLQYT